MLARHHYDVFEFVSDLIAGDTSALIVLAVIVSTIAFFALYQKLTGQSFVKNKSERRAARNRRKFVFYESKRTK